jgi:hypothetical protein
MIVVLCCALVALRGVMIGPLAWSGIDDANITYAFAENIASGHGYTYGHEDGVVVEGSTSLAWTMLLSAVSAIGAPIGIVSVLLSTVFLAGAALLCMVIVRRTGGTPLQAAAVAVLFLFTPGVIEWQALSGLESGLWCFAFLLTWYVLAYTRSISAQVMVLVLLLTVRPEAMLYAPVIVVLAIAYRRRTEATSMRIPVIQMSVVVITIIAMTVMRMAIFDAPLPNTFYAKVGSFSYNLGNGLHYIVRLFKLLPAPWLLLGVVLVMDRSWMRHLDPFVLLALLTFTQPILTGGDHFYLGRFSQIHWPLVWIIVVAYAAKRDWSRMRSSIAIASVIVLIQFVPGSLFREDRVLVHALDTHHRTEFEIGEKGRRIGVVLSRMFPNAPRPVVGVLAAGGVAQTYEGPLRDLLGLCNPEVRSYPPTAPSGMPNHDAFSMQMLRAANVDMLHVELIRDRGEYRTWLSETADKPSSFDNMLMKGALRTTEFRNMFIPAMLSNNGDTVCALVSRTWTRGRGQVQVEIVGW